MVQPDSDLLMETSEEARQENKHRQARGRNRRIQVDPLIGLQIWKFVIAAGRIMSLCLGECQREC
jgi:hypothetical protein